MHVGLTDDDGRPAVQGRLASIRHHLDKPPGTVLHFASNIKEHGARVYVCREIGGLAELTVSNVVMCKRLLEGAPVLTSDPQSVYLYTLRLTLERVSWIARDRNNAVVITFAHVKNFPYDRLREYLDIMRAIPTSIHWPAIQDVRINQPKKLVGEGALRGPVIDRELPLKQAAEAHRLIENRETFGKVVLKRSRQSGV
jgi:NADPH:quinone reductase-like Zn-dependent oxidoreductase